MDTFSLDELRHNRDRQINRVDFTLSLQEVYWDTKMQISELYGKNVNRGRDNAFQIFAQKELTPHQIKMLEARLKLAGTYEEMMQILTDNNADHLIYPEES
jgi:hypothetical protein